MAKDVLVYTTDPCPYCSRVKQLLAARGIDFDEVPLARDPAGREALAERTGMLTFPQVLIRGELVGGFQETLAADRSGRLRQLVDAA
jgi:glutaredoxin 3